jgi:hypothetical protein
MFFVSPPMIYREIANKKSASHRYAFNGFGTLVIDRASERELTVFYCRVSFYISTLSVFRSELFVNTNHFLNECDPSAH